MLMLLLDGLSIRRLPYFSLFMGVTTAEELTNHLKALGASLSGLHDLESANTGR